MLEIKPYHIQSIIKDAGFGGTYPIIVKANGKEYVLKHEKMEQIQKTLAFLMKLLLINF